MSDSESMADPAPAGGASGDDDRGVALRAGAWRLALPVRELRAIRQPLPVARVPGARPWVIGAANGRGRLLPVVDLLGYLEERARDAGGASQWLELEHEDRIVAVRVDTLSGLRRFRWEDTAVPPADVPPRLAACVSGSAHDDDGDWLRLSVAALWRQPDFLDLRADDAQGRSPC